MAGITKTHVQLGDSATATQNFMLTAQAADGTMKLSRGNNGATTQDILTVNAAGLVTMVNGEVITASKIQSGTVQNTTSGTSIDFTGIPSWAKRITVMFNGVSTNGASAILFQLGATTVDTTGYNGAGVRTGGAAVGSVAYNTGFGLNLVIATDTYSGLVTLCKLDGNVWAANGLFAGVGQTFGTGGAKTLAAILDRVRITTANGTDTFDAGSINITWE